MANLDPNFASVALLLHGDGANASTTFVDVTGKVMTPTGSVQISTAQSMFGGASINFAGTGFIGTPNAAVFDFSGTADFTLEAWIFGTDYSAYTGIFAARPTSGVLGWTLYVGPGGKLSMYGYLTGSGGTGLYVLHTTLLVPNVWTHVALVKQAAGYTAYINGVAGTLAALTGGFQYQPGYPVVVGAFSSQGQYPFIGFIDDVRISKGFARYTANFTPPINAFANGAARVTGVIRDSTGTPCARTVRLIQRDTGAPAGSAVSDASTGVYEIYAPSLNEVVRIVHSNTITAPLENDLIDRVMPA